MDSLSQLFLLNPNNAINHINLCALCGLMFFVLNASISFSAYHHEDEIDSDRFLAAYPEKTGTKLDHCALCHSGGQYINSKGSEVSLGSCQWCHYSYGYDGSGNIAYTLNLYGKDYYFNGRDAAEYLLPSSPNRSFCT